MNTHADPANKDTATKPTHKEGTSAPAQPVSAKSALRGVGFEDATRALAPRPVQRSGGAGGTAGVCEVAASGIQGGGAKLPHLDAIQSSFGCHDVSGVRAHADGPASAASRAMGASAYASGDHVAFDGAPSLHTAAHETAHVVQQRGGVQLQGGVGKAGDPYEQHADRVAETVVAGGSAEPLLDELAGPAAASGRAVQHQLGSGRAAAVQRRDVGLHTEESMKTYATSAKKYQGALNSLSDLDKIAQDLCKATSAELTAAYGTPALGCHSVEGFSPDGAAEFDGFAWSMKLYKGLFEGSISIPEDKLKALKATIYHESRHAEQLFRVLRYIYKTSDVTKADMLALALTFKGKKGQETVKLPPDVVEAACKGDKDESFKDDDADKWVDTTLPVRDAQKYKEALKAYEKNSTARVELDKAQADYKKALVEYVDLKQKHGEDHPLAKKKKEEALALRQQVKEKDKALEEAVAAYKKLPREEDAYKVQAELEKHL